MELDSTAKVVRAFYRLVATESGDSALTVHGEDADEVAYLALTAGCRAAQRWMIDNGYQGWRKRSEALSWTGTDAEDGGRYAALPSDFLKAYGSERRSALVEPNGKRWGSQIHPDEDDLQGNLFYFRGQDELWLARTAAPPTTLYLDYHYMHPAWSSTLDDDGGIDFPMEARTLIAPEAAHRAKEDNWLPGGQELEFKIMRARNQAQLDARRVCRASKAPRRMKAPRRVGNHW